MPARVDPERRAAAAGRLGELRDAGQLTAGHVRLAAAGLGVSERTVWRWLGIGEEGKPTGPQEYRLSAADLEAFAWFRGNVAAVHRARAAVVNGDGRAAGVPVPDFLCEGWAGAVPVALRTLQLMFARELSPGERLAWQRGEEGYRAAAVYLRRQSSHRNETWEMDHKQLPVLVLPGRGMTACCPWLTSVVDDG